MWESLPSSIPLTKVKCFRERFLEPYVMVKKNGIPLFDERFINYGYNKVEWIEHLRYMGFEFHVLSQSYAVDMPHSPYVHYSGNQFRSNYAKEYKKGFKDGYIPMLSLYRRFLTDLRNNHPDESRQVLCLRSGSYCYW